MLATGVENVPLKDLNIAHTYFTHIRGTFSRPFLRNDSVMKSRSKDTLTQFNVRSSNQSEEKQKLNKNLLIASAQRTFGRSEIKALESFNPTRRVYSIK